MSLFFVINVILTTSFVAGTGSSACAQAMAVPPGGDWKILQTPHFEIIFNAEQRRLAETYAKEAEGALAKLRNVFTDIPEKTVIVLDDTTDFTNGLATPLPRSSIHLYPVLPEPGDSLDFYGNWPQELVTHEFTHILTFEPTSGIMKPLRFVFGSLIRPNGILPRWYLEGLAVYMESWLTTHGRLRSPYITALIRSLVLDDRLRHETLGRINETSIPTVPFGDRPYLLGGLFLDDLFSQKTPAISGDITRQFGGRIPFFLNAPFEERYGKELPELWTETKTHLTQKANAQLSLVRQSPVSKGTPLHGSNKFTSADTPALSPNGLKLSYLRHRPDHDSEIIVYTRPSRTESFNANPGKVQIEARGVQRIEWLQKQPKLIFDMTVPWDRYYGYADLFQLDPETRTMVRLTRGQRLSDAVSSPDDQTIVAVQRASGKSTLVKFPLASVTALVDPKKIVQTPDHPKPVDPNRGSEVVDRSPEVTVLYQPAAQERISNPNFLNATTVIFLDRNLAGEEELKIMDVSGGGPDQGTPQTIATEPKLDSFLRVRDGLITARSSESGVMNLFEATLPVSTTAATAPKKLKLHPVTNVETAVISAARDPSTSKIWWTRMNGTGSQLEEGEVAGPGLKLAQVDSFVKLPPPPPTPPPAATAAEETDPTSPTAGQNGQAKKPAAEAEGGDVRPYVDDDQRRIRAFEPATKDYNGLAYLWPQYWIPFFSFIPQGYVAQALVSAQDPLGRHLIDVNLGYDNLTNMPSIAADYTNSATAVQYTFAGQNTYSYLYGFNTAVQVTGGSAIGSFFIPGLSSDWTAGLGVRDTNISYPGLPFTTLVGPTAQVSYNNVKGEKGFQISPNSGYRLSGSYTYFPSALSTIEFGQATVDGALYIPSPIGHRQVIAFSTSSFFTPRNRSILIDAPTAGGDYGFSLLHNKYVVRGYPVGEFVNWSLTTASLEYRLPLWYAYQGPDIVPVFWQRWHMAILLDGLSGEGAYFDSNQSTPTQSFLAGTHYGNFFFGAGVEFRADISIAYNMTAQLQLGLYDGLSTYAYGGFTPYLGFNVDGLLK